MCSCHIYWNGSRDTPEDRDFIDLKVQAMFYIILLGRLLAKATIAEEARKARARGEASVMSNQAMPKAGKLLVMKSFGTWA